MPEFEYVVPETLAEACAVLGQFGGRAKVLAGRRESYFNRTWEHFCSHQHTPPKTEPSGYCH